LAGAGRRELEQRYQGSSGSGERRPGEFSRDQEQLRKRQTDIGKGGKRDGREERVGKTGVVCQLIDCGGSE